MKPERLMMIALLSLSALPVQVGATPLVTTEPVPWRDGKISLGDAEAQVREIAGKYPDRVIALTSGESYPIGEQWMFIGDRQPKQLLWVELMRGRVTRMWTEAFDRQGKAPAVRAP